MDDTLWLLSWNLRNGLVPPDRSLRDTLGRRRWPAACSDKEHLITGMLPQQGCLAIMRQETGIATRAQGMHVALALRDKGYTPFFSNRLAETGSNSTQLDIAGGGAPHRSRQQLRAQARSAGLHGTRTQESHGHGNPHRQGSPHPHQRPRAAGRVFPLGRAGGFLGRHTNVCHGMQLRWTAPGGHRRRHQHLHGSRRQPGQGAPPLGPGGLHLLEGTAGGVEDMTPTLHPSRQRVDTFLVNEPLLPWSLRDSFWAEGMAQPHVDGSDYLLVRLALRGLLDAAGQAAVPTPHSHREGCLLPYNAEAAPVERCLWAAVTTAQDEPSLAPWLGPAKQHTYRFRPAAAVDKVFEHLHTAHDALARVVGHRQTSPAGSNPMGGDAPKVGSGPRGRSSGLTPRQRAH